MLIFFITDDKENRKIYVDNLEVAIDTVQLSTYFGKYGTVISSNIVFDRVNMKNCGFVIYEDLNFYEKCLKQSYHEIDSRKVNVKKAIQPSICKIKAQIPSVVKMNKEEITTYFEQFGKIIDIDLFIPESEVLIRFQDRESVIRTLNQENHRLGEVTFTVKEIEKKKRPSKNSKDNGDCKNQQRKRTAPKRKSQYHQKQHLIKRPRISCHGNGINNYKRGKLREMEPKKCLLTNYYAPLKINSFQQYGSTIPTDNRGAFLRDQQKTNPSLPTRNNATRPMFNPRNQQNSSMLSSRPMLDQIHRTHENGYQQNFRVNCYSDLTSNQMPPNLRNRPGMNYGLYYDQNHMYHQNSNRQNFPVPSNRVARNSYSQTNRRF